jgi:quercetin dioxygenase-like cupin family protein
MRDFYRRSAVALGLAAATGAVLTVPDAASAQTYGPNDGREVAPGVRRVDVSRREISMGAYKAVALRDIVLQPGAKLPTAAMRNDMVCHCLEGELHIDQGPGMQFVARKGDVWICTTGMPEGVTNNGSAVGIMRITDLLT